MNSDSNISNPYPGPRPFIKEERARFFGREAEVGDIFSLITAEQVLLLYAQSGAGKTSLLNAGLIPMLNEEGAEILPVARFGSVIPAKFKPEELPNIYTFSALMQWVNDENKAEGLREESLAGYLKQREHPLDKRGVPVLRVIIFDQFEEIFTFHQNHWRKREEFFKDVGQALKADPLLRVVFAIREDYIAQLDPYVAFLPDRLRTRFRLERLKKDEALSAITNPLRGTGRSFAEGVAEALVSDLLKIRVESEAGDNYEVLEVVGEFVEPVQLQVVCRGIWHELPPQATQITHEHLRAVGDIDKVLSKFYADAVRAAAEQCQCGENQIRTWCEEKLITPTGTRGTVYRERETTGGLKNSAIDMLEAMHLIRAERRAGGRWYELTHDRFIGPIKASNKEYLTKIEEAYNILLEGDQAYRAGNYDKAAESYNKAFSLYQHLGAPFYQAYALELLGWTSYELGALEEAFKFFQEAARIYIEIEDRRAVTSLIGMGNIYQRLEEFDLVINVGNILIEFAPDEPQAYHLRAAAYWYSGKYEEAVEDFNSELRLVPDSLWALNGRGQVLAEMGRYPEAVEDLTRAIELAKEQNNHEALAYASNGLGLAYAGLGKYKEAMATFNASLEGHPDNAWVYFNRARAYIGMGDLEKAKRDLQTALEKKNPALNPIKRQVAEEYLNQKHNA